jgi:hypothetical protein
VRLYPYEVLERRAAELAFEAPPGVLRVGGGRDQGEDPEPGEGGCHGRQGGTGRTPRDTRRTPSASATGATARG